MTTIIIPISPEVMDFLDEDREETGIKNYAGVISDIIMNYRRDRALARINEARAECDAGLEVTGDLREIMKNY